MGKEIFYEDDIFTVTKGDKFLISELKDVPKGISAFDTQMYHSDEDEFKEYKDRFVGVYNVLKQKVENAYFILCKKTKYIENISFKYDVRNRLTNEEVSELLIKHFNTKKAEAIVKLNELVAKRDELNAGVNKN